MTESVYSEFLKVFVQELKKHTVSKDGLGRMTAMTLMFGNPDLEIRKSEAKKNLVGFGYTEEEAEEQVDQTLAAFSQVKNH